LADSKFSLTEAVIHCTLHYVLPSNKNLQILQNVVTIKKYCIHWSKIWFQISPGFPGHVVTVLVTEDLKLSYENHQIYLPWFIDLQKHWGEDQIHAHVTWTSIWVPLLWEETKLQCQPVQADKAAETVVGHMCVVSTWGMSHMPHTCQVAMNVLTCFLRPRGYCVLNI
jgi:hypothetical protein